jgi:nitroreductase
VISIVVEFSGLVPDWEEIAATSMAVQNMYLTCTANRIGCYWSSPKIVNNLKDSLKIERINNVWDCFIWEVWNNFY